MTKEEEEDETNSMRGILTETDKSWINGESVGAKSDQKRRSKQRITLAAEDIKTIVDSGRKNNLPSNLDRISELFENTVEDVGLSNQELAKYLISLAFIVTNEDIDYPELVKSINLHPRSEEDSPRDEGRPAKGAPIDFSQPVDELLAFRDALSEGVKLGKEYVDDQPPETLLFDANTRLYKEPTEDRLRTDEFGGFDQEDLWDALALAQDAGTPGDNKPEKLSPKEAREFLVTEINANVGYRLSRRRAWSDQDIIRNEFD